jgi:hypothetical protein
VAPPDEERAVASFDLASFERLVRVETKLDSVITSKSVEHDSLVDDIKDHEGRIRSLERVWWKTAGIAAGISALIASGAFAVYMNLLGGAA